jgi:7-keto-8-aminopelargonate synthetase-like enzyme
MMRVSMLHGRLEGTFIDMWQRARSQTRCAAAFHPPAASAAALQSLRAVQRRLADPAEHGYMARARKGSLTQVRHVE